MNQAHDDTNGSVLAATFADRETAHAAADDLKDAGFHEVWIGVAKRHTGDGADGATQSVEAENWFERLMGEGDVTLHEALIRRGVSEADAAAAGALGTHGAVLTVDGHNHPEAAAQVLAESGGRLISSGYGATGFGTSGSHALYDEDAPVGAVASAPRADYGSYRAGETIDDEQRLQLREERLRVARERRAAGSAEIGKRVVEATEELDVPVTHEELFIERRPVGTVTGNVGTIGADSEIVRIPLSEERVRIEKDTVVTEEVVVGKRTVTDTQHVAATTRREVLDIDESSTAAAGTNARSL